MKIEQLVALFREGSMERLARLEAGWMKVQDDPGDDDALAAVYREVHTIKGDARMLGLTDVDLACHKLEDMFEFAREKQFAVSDEFDLVVMMAVQLIGVLVTKRADDARSGIDLPGFIAEMDAVVADLRLQPAPRRGPAGIADLGPGDGLSPDSYDDLTRVIETFVAAQVGGPNLEQSRRSWQALRGLLALPAPIPVAPLFAKYELGAAELARELGKDVAIRFEIERELVADPSIYAAVEVAALHLVRNAIDHGVAAPGERRGGGRATVQVRCWSEAEHVRLEVADDGPGIDFAEVRRRAIARGLLRSTRPSSEAQLLDVLFLPGFSTRATATEVSGRGIGLDAVAAAVRACGGAVTARSIAGHGVTWSIEIPAPAHAIAAHRLVAPGSSMPFAIPSDWTLEVTADAAGALDLGAHYGVAGAPRAGAGAVGAAVAITARRGELARSFLAEAPPVACSARRLIVMQPDATAEIVAIDGIEGLLVRPEALIDRRAPDHR